MNLRDVCFHLRNRRRMYLLDDRFSTAAAFVEGYNTAFDGVPLSDFQEYVAVRTTGRRSNIHWAYLIAATAMPEILVDGLGIDQIPADLEIPLTDKLVDLLEAYGERDARSGERM